MQNPHQHLGKVLEHVSSRADGTVGGGGAARPALQEYASSQGSRLLVAGKKRKNQVNLAGASNALAREFCGGFGSTWMNFARVTSLGFC